MHEKKGQHRAATMKGTGGGTSVVSVEGMLACEHVASVVVSQALEVKLQFSKVRQLSTLNVFNQNVLQSIKQTTNMYGCSNQIQVSPTGVTCPLTSSLLMFQLPLACLGGQALDRVVLTVTVISIPLAGIDAIAIQPTIDEIAMSFILNISSFGHFIANVIEFPFGLGSDVEWALL
jgi:hypothetical protein